MADSDQTTNNSPYSDQELKHFEDLLKEEHQQTNEKIREMKESVDDLRSNSVDEQSASAHHQGDIGSEEDEREKLLIVLQKESEKLEEVNAALNRLENGTYGICKKSGDKIQKERLEAIPYARYSIETQQEDEKPGNS